MTIVSDILQDKVMEGWLLGKKRSSRHSNDVFATKKDKRIFELNFKEPRLRKRLTKDARRAKSVRD